MKKIIVLIACLLTIEASSTNTVVNKYIFNVDAFTYAAMDYLEIDSVMVGIVRLPYRFSAKAIVQKCSEHTYNIYVSSGLDYSTALIAIAHELVHIKQAKDGRLDLGLGTTRLKQDGSIAFRNTRSRELEREAKKVSRTIYNDLKRDYSF